MRLHTTLTLCVLILFSGMNCHHKAMDMPDIIPSNAATWAEIHANSDAIDSALNSVFSELREQAKTTMVRRRPLEIVAPIGPNTLIFKDSLQ